MTLSRREFLQVMATSAAVAPVLSSVRLGAADEAFVRHGAIGASGQAWSDLESFATHPAFRCAGRFDASMGV